MEMMGLIWRYVRRSTFQVAATFGGLLCGFSGLVSRLTDSSLCTITLGPLFALLYTLGLCVLAVKRPSDPTVEWEWEDKLSHSVLGEKRLPILCRRHLTTRAQGRMLGCNTTRAAMGAIAWLQRKFNATVTEMALEVDKDMTSLATHARQFAVLHDAIGTLNSMSFIHDFQMIESNGKSQISQKAKAMRAELTFIEEQVNKIGVKTLDDLIRRGRTLASPKGIFPPAFRDEVRDILAVVKDALKKAGDSIVTAQKLATSLHCLGSASNGNLGLSC
jgi:hypothetical protein